MSTNDTLPQVVFIDSRVPDIQDLLNGLAPGEVAYVIDGSSDGLQQIANILAANNLTHVGSISIVAHGAAGALELGSTVLDEADLASEAPALAQIGAALGSGGALQLYACNVASGATGQQFIADLSSFIGGAPVAASTQDIGQTATGENWTLDAISGPAAGSGAIGGPNQVSPASSTAAGTQISDPFTAAAEAQFAGTLTVPTTELWMAATSGGANNLIIHSDDTGTHTASNVGTLFTPTSTNNPSSADGLNGIDLLAFDTQDGKYFLATQNTTATELVEGSLFSAESNPTATPTFTTLFSDTNHTIALTGLAADPGSAQVFFDDGHNFYKNSFTGNTGTVTTLGSAGSTPSSPFLDGLALDLPHHVAYFLSGTSTTTTTTTKNGQPDPSDSHPTANVHFNYNTVFTASIYETSSLTASSTTVSISQLVNLGNTLGTVFGIGEPGLAVDTTTGTVYFTTETVAGNAHKAAVEGGIFALNPTTHAITTLFRQDGVHGPTGTLGAIQVDDATGLYYVSVVGTNGEGGQIWVGSLSGGTPTLFETLPTFNGGTTNPVPDGFAIDNAPSLSITPTNPTFTESTLNPASSHNTPVGVLSTDTDSDSDNTKADSATVSIGGFFAGDVLSFTNVGSVTGSYNSSTGVLTFTGEDVLADYQSVLQSVQFTSTSDNPTDFGSDTTRTLTWTVNDGLLNSAPQTETVTVVGVNDPPTLSNVLTGNWTEKGGAKTVASGASVFDPDSLTLANATVAIVGGTFAGDGDVLATTTTGTSITASYNAATETLVLSGSDTLAHYQSVLDKITFNSTTLNPDNYGSNTTRTVTWLLNDGAGSFNLSTVTTSTVSVTAVNDPPTLTGTNATVSFTEGTPVTLSPSVTVTDPDSLRIASATVKVTGGTFANDGDVLTASTVGTAITASYNAATETLTLTGSDTFADYQTVLDKVTFGSGSNPDNFGSNTTRTVTWVLNDGAGSSNLSSPATTTINVTAINDPPVLSAVTPTVTYVENASQLTLASTATVSDVDSLTLASATVQVVGGAFAGDGDDFRVNGVGNGGAISLAAGHTVTINYNSVTETLTLTGSDTIADYQTLIEEVSFRSTSDNPTNFGANQTRTLTWVLNDGAASNNLSSVTTSTIDVTAVNDPPTLTNTATSASFTENTAAITLSPSVTVTDPDNTTLAGATVKVAGGTFTGDGDVLAANTAGTAITASYDTTSETLTLSGADTLADYRNVLDTVTFVTASDNPTDFGADPTRTVTWVLNDGSGSSNLSSATTTTVSITAINDPPTLANVAASAAYTENASATVLSSTLSVVDPDSLTLHDATVKITGGTFAGDGDVLSFSAAGTSITASYNAGTETLTLSGSDSLAHYQSVLDSVAFSSTSDNPTSFGSDPTRTITWIANDGAGSFNLSTVQTTTVSITAVNDPPTLAGTANASFTENAAAVTVSPNVTVTDPDNTTLVSAAVKIDGGTFAGDGDVLAANTAGTSITASYDAGDNILLLSGSDTLAHYQSVLDTVTFLTTSHNPTDFGADPTRLLVWVLDDGAASNNLSTGQVSTISITAINDPPTLSGVPASASVAVGQTVTLAAAAAVADPDNLDLASATVTITAGAFTGDVLAADTTGTSITASYNSTTETLTLSGSDTLAHYQSVLDTVNFSSTAPDPTNANANPTRTLSWTLNDGALSSTAQTETLTIQNGPAINPPAHAAFTENQVSPTTLAPSLVVTDSNGGASITSATVALTGGTFASDGDVLAATSTGNITVSYDTTNEVLTLTGTDTLANYKAVLDTVSFTTPSDNPTDFGADPTRTVVWTVTDSNSSNNTGSATSTIDITAVNDPPTLAGTTDAAFTENTAAVTLSPSVTVTDPDNATLAGATVAIATGTFAGDGDVLAAATAGTSITASYNAASETLVLSGSDTLAHYQSVLDTVTFVTASDNPDDFGADPTRTLTWVLNDGSGSSNLSAPATTTVAITAINDPPTITAATTDLFVTGQTLTLSPSLSATDPDSLDLASATVSITAGGFAGDVLAANTAGTSISASYDSTNELLTLTGADTVAHYQQVLDSVTFSSTAADPTNANNNPTRTVTWVANDGAGSFSLSATQTTTVDLKLGPALFVPANAAFTEQGPATTLSSSIALSDSNPGASILSATVALTGGTFVGDGDVLAATPTGNIAVSYDAANEALILSGSDTIANYRSVLDSVTFTTPVDNPDDFGADPTRTVTWTVADDSGGPNATGTATTSIAITAVNDPPTLTNVATGAQFTEGNAPTVLSSLASVSDPDNLDLAGATVSITTGKFAGDGDVLSASTAGTSITASYDTTSEVLVLSGSDTLAHYQSVLDSVAFSSTSDNPTDFGAIASHQVTWLINDGSASNNFNTPINTTTVTLTAVNDPPTVAGQAVHVPFTVGNTVTLSPSLSVSDPDSVQLTSATVSVTGGTFASDGDVLGFNTAGTSISASYNAATETLALTGSDTLAHYQSVLDGVTFASGNNPNNSNNDPTRTITWVVNDGSGSSNFSSPVTTTVDIAHEPPTLTGVTDTAFTQGNTTTLSPGASVTDFDSANLASATVKITGDTFAGDGDVLSANAVGNITVSYDPATETLTLTGIDTLAHYQSVLDTVRFQSGSDPTNHGVDPTRTVTWLVNDGNASEGLSQPAISTITITPLDQPPTLISVAATASFTENQSAVTLAPNLDLTDSDSTQMTSATVAIAGGTFAGDGDVLGFSTAGTSITASYNSATETLTLTGADSLADYQGVLRTVTFVTPSDNPTDFGADPSRLITWTVADNFNVHSAAQTTTVNVTAVNDAPVLTGTTPTVSFLAGTTLQLGPTLSVSDVDSLNLANATVKITGGTFLNDGDVLAANVAGTHITSSYNPATETLVLTGPDPVATFQAVMESITFSSGANPTNFGSNPTRTLTWVVNDGSGSNNLSSTATTTIDITAINSPPALANVPPVDNFTEGQTFTLAGAASVADPDNIDLANATVAITGGAFAGDGDLLAFSTTGTAIAASYNSATETLTLTGSDTLAHYSQVLDSVTFQSGLNPDNFGSNPTRTVTWVLNDGSASNNLSTIQTTTISITAVNNPPTLTGTTAAAFTENAAAVTLSPSVTVSDPDNLGLVGATVAITGGTFAGDGDILGFNTAGTAISASYDTTAEVLMLSGFDSFAHYAQVLDSVTFVTPSDNPTSFGADPTRTIAWTLNDGSASSPTSTVTTTVGITAINDPPTLASVGTSASWTEKTAAVTLSSNVSVSDPDNQNLAGATVKITGGTFATDGDQLGAVTVGNVTVSYNPASETLFLTGIDTLAHYQQVLDTVTFNSTSLNPTNFGLDPTRTVTWTLNDGSGSFNTSAPQTTTVSITAVNDPPTVTGVASNVGYIEQAAAVTLSGGVTVVDPDSAALVNATVRVTGGTFAGDGDVLGFSTAGTAITGSYNSATETLVFSGADTAADYQSVLRSVTFFDPSDNPTNFGSNPSRVLTWVVNDGSASNNTNAPLTTTVNITAVNDPPTLSNVPGKISFIPNHTRVIAPSLTLSDPDSLTMANATLKITAGTFVGDGDVLGFSTAGTAIVASYNAATETLTLTGSDTLAHYQSVLDSVTFASGSNPTNSGLDRSRTLTWVVNDGSGSNNLSAVMTTTIAIGGLKDDFNGDGFADVLFQDGGGSPDGRDRGGDPNAGTPLVWLLGGNGTSVASQATLSNPGATWNAVTAADFDGDGKADILFQNSDGTPVIWTMNGTSVTGTINFADPASGLVAVGAGDVNGDGFADVVWRNNTTGAWGFTDIHNGATFHNLGGSNTGYTVAGIGDFNADGNADVLWRNNTTGAWGWSDISTGSNNFHALGNSNTGYSVVGVGDINGDGTDDVLWRNNTTGAWGYSDISAGSNNFHSLGNSNTAYNVVAVADFNGDGQADVLWQNPTTNVVGYSVGNGGIGPMAFQVLGTTPPHFTAVS